MNYKYDKNDNLRFSLDGNQLHREDDMIRTFTFRGYDGINRLIYLGVINNLSYTTNWDNLNGETTYNFETYSTVPEDYLTINVYDTLSTVFANIFSPPSGYYSGGSNNTSGKLVSTAYRTNGGENWNYKYYRTNRGENWNYKYYKNNFSETSNLFVILKLYQNYLSTNF